MTGTNAQCPVDGTPLPAPTGPARPRQWCSEACRKHVHHQRRRLAEYRAQAAAHAAQRGALNARLANEYTMHADRIVAELAAMGLAAPALVARG